VTSESRSAELTRKTGETDVSLQLDLDGDGAGSRDTGVGFLDHMLDLFARHGHFDLTVNATGDLKTGAHHTVEDVGIVLGQAIDKALGDRSRITRYATATIPMDEARATCSIDISGRPFVLFEGGALTPGLIGDFDAELTEEFLRALANNSNLTLHVTVEAGSNAHHIVEAVFKSLARALRAAVAIDPDQHGVPSTKGTLTD
jgi:imidazoleglycerol-phosphate dehydratase